MFTKEFKLAAVQRLERGSSIGEVARALEVNPNVLHRWRRENRQGPVVVYPGHGKQRWAEGRIAELERKICQQALEIVFEGALAAHRGTADAAGVDWKSAVYQKPQEEVKAGGRLTVERMVKLGRVSRSGFYRFDDADPGPDFDMDLRDVIPEGCRGMAQLRAAAHDQGAARARLEGKSEARLLANARGQPAVRAQGASSSSPPIPTTPARSIPTWRGT
jgi:hypothetical protein